MPPPDFLVIGAQKAGTTALYGALRQHPGLFLPERKEPHFFCSVGDGTPMTWAGPGDGALLPLFTVDREQYEALFDDADGRLCGECSTGYLHDPDAPARVAAVRPDARLVVLLREPVERAYSAWWMWRRVGVEPLEFDAAVAAEEQRLADGWGLTYAYRGIGMYATHLEQWRRWFDASQMLVLRSDRVRSDAPTAWRSIFEFLGVDPDIVPGPVDDLNVARAPRRVPTRWSRWVQQPPLRSIGRRFTSVETRRRVVDRLSRPGPARTPMSPSMAGELRGSYRPELQRVEQMVGLDLSDWWMDQP